MITRTFTINDINPAEMARVFACWGGDEQAAFFGAVAKEADGWRYGRSSFCMQALHIAAALDADGRYIIERIADHAGLIPDLHSTPSGLSLPESDSADHLGVVIGRKAAGV